MTLKKRSLEYLERLAPYAFLALFTLLISWPVLVSRTGSFYVLPDNVQQFYPWYQKLSQAVHSGYLPFWDANAFTGHFFLGEFQAGMFYPPNLLWVLLFGTPTGIDIYYLELLVVFHFFLASLGMYLLGREWGLGRISGLGAAVVFAYSGAVAFRAEAQICIFYGLALLPFVIFFLARYVKTSRLLYLIAAGIVMGLQVLAGHIQPPFHTAVIASFYLLSDALRRQGGIRRRVIRFAGALALLGVIACAASAPQLVPGLEYLQVAYRNVGAARPLYPGEVVPFAIFAYTNIVEPSQFLNLLDPAKYYIPDGNEIYIGVFPLLLIALFLVRRAPTSSGSLFRANRLWLLALAVLAVLAMVGHYTPLSLLLNGLPLVNSIREPGRYVILLHFVLALLVGLAILSVQEFPLWGRTEGRRLALLTVASVFLFLLYIWSLDLMRSFSLTAAYQVGLALCFALLAIALRRRANALAALTLLLLCAGLVLDRDVYIPKIEGSQYAPATFAKNKIIEYLEPYYGQYRVAEADPAHNALPWNIGDVYPIQTKMGWGATVYGPYWDLIRRDWSVNSQVNDALNVRFIVSKTPLNLKLVLQDAASGLRLYERNSYYPKLLFKGEMGMPGKSIDALKEFDVLQYGDEYQKYLVRAPRSDELIFSEFYFPGWHVYIDGKEAELTASSIKGSAPVFDSVSLEQGSHLVELKYNLDIIFVERKNPVVAETLTGQ